MSNYLHILKGCLSISCFNRDYYCIVKGGRPEGNNIFVDSFTSCIQDDLNDNKGNFFDLKIEDKVLYKYKKGYYIEVDKQKVSVRPNEIQQDSNGYYIIYNNTRYNLDMKHIR